MNELIQKNSFTKGFLRTNLNADNYFFLASEKERESTTSARGECIKVTSWKAAKGLNCARLTNFKPSGISDWSSPFIDFGNKFLENTLPFAGLELSLLRNSSYRGLFLSELHQHSLKKTF